MVLMVGGSTRVGSKVTAISEAARLTFMDWMPGRVRRLVRSSAPQEAQSRPSTGKRVVVRERCWG